MSKRIVRLYDTINVPQFDGSPEKIKFINDNFFGTNKSSSLMIRVAATHAGLITRNNGFYLPDKMAEGVKTMTSPYPKPILRHHDNHDDAIGRIVSAEYINTSGALLKKDSKFEEFINPKASFISKVNLIDALFEDGYLEDSSFQGLGYASVIAKITDPTAIQKIIDNRYMTVSIGASTDKAVCSICKQDWVEEGPCEHRPGKMYDDKPAFIIAGKLTYEELSFVNSPADPFARVIEVQNSAEEVERFELEAREDEEPITDQYAELFIITDDNQYAANLLHNRDGKSTEEGVKNLLRDIDNSKDDIHDDSEEEASEKEAVVDEDEPDKEESSEDAAMRSPQSGAHTGSKKKKKKKKKSCKDDESTEEEKVNKEDKKVKTDAEEIKEEEKVEEKKEDSTEALDTKGKEEDTKVEDKKEDTKEDKKEEDIEDTIEDEEEEKVEDKKEEDKEEDKEEEKVEDKKEEDKDTEEEIIEDKKEEDEKKEEEKIEDGKEKEEDNIEDKVEEEKEIDDEKKEEEKKEDNNEDEEDEEALMDADSVYEAFIKFFEESEEFKDAKLGTAQRKKLPTSAFCGPNRSFPVPDCAHVTAARRLIGRYKGPGDKSKILACVNRKAKAMGCDKKKDEVETKEIETKKVETKEIEK
jgi:hypothetical protein